MKALILADQLLGSAGWSGGFDETRPNQLNILTIMNFFEQMRRTVDVPWDQGLPPVSAQESGGMRVTIVIGELEGIFRLWRHGEEIIVEDATLDPEVLLKIARTRMPFGKYKGRLLIDLPEPYVIWFAKNGFPKGELGRMLSILYEVKLNGLEYLFKPLRGSGG
jgi:uncharacterized protein (DUF3820 family)